MNENKAGLGYQDFEEVRTQHIFYIDKTDFIREWWEYADKVTLITRPRRFGKTLNMSMTECFFSNKYAGRGIMNNFYKVILSPPLLNLPLESAFY